MTQDVPPQSLKLSKSIVLVGLMGAGKTCIGTRLAAKLGLPFVDADTEIERAAGCSVPDIFELYGESEFRKGERRVIARLLKDPVQVLATGGGAFMDSATRKEIRNRAISVWLRADLNLLVSRTGRRTDRPLLENGNRREILKRLIEERHPIYAEADLVIDSAQESPDLTVDRLIGALEKFTGGSAVAADAAQ
jgi:shikimate kinase